MSFDPAKKALSGARSTAYAYDLECKTAFDSLTRFMDAEPEDTLLSSDYRYLIACTEKVMTKVRNERHPVGHALIVELNDVRNALTGELQAMKVRSH